MIRVDNKVYKITDYKCNEFTVSTTILHAGMNTNGHNHENAEGYYVISGTGILETDKTVNIAPMEFYYIKPNLFHKVYNDSNSDLMFICFWINNQENCIATEKN